MTTPRPRRARRRRARRALAAGARVRPRARRAGRGGARRAARTRRLACRSTSRTWPRSTVATRRAPGRPRSPSSPARLGAGAVVAAGSDRGNEVLAHVAARLDLPFAANCIDVLGGGAGARAAPALGRQPARGGARPRRARAAHGRPARGRGRRGAGDGPRRAASRRPWSRADLVVRVSETVDDGGRRRLARRGQGRRLRRPRRRLRRGLRDHRGARRPARRRGRLLARGDERRLAAAHRPGRPDRHEDLARPLHRLRDQRRDAAHRRLQGREEAARDQRRRRGADPRAAPTTR